MATKRRSRRALYAAITEKLEARCLLAANLHIDDAYFVDSDFETPLPNPTVGTGVYMRVDFTTTDLPSNANYILNTNIQGVDYPYSVSWGAGDPGSGDLEFIYGPITIARNGPFTASETLDSANTVAESDETDNAISFSFTPVQESLQSKLTQPLGAVAERNYGYVNYVDEDPTSPGFQDYRGGPYTYDGHDAIDMAFPSFASMDAGMPVIATEAGTVVDVHDGEFDRNTVGSPDANYIEIDSGNGYQEYYYHLRDGSVGVQVGQEVTQGQVIGLMGSSGNSTGPHLHFALYNGGAVETYQDPFTYWQNPVPYEGDVDFVDDSGVTNYDPNSILNAEEEPTKYLNFKQQAGQTVYAWFNSFTAANEPMTFTLYQPNGAAFATFNDLTTANPDRGGAYEVGFNLPSSPALGTWQVGFTVNGIELARDSFSVTSTGTAEAQVTQNGTFIANTRTTPISGGTYSHGATATPLSFTVTNAGNATMTLGTPTLPAGWTLTDPLATSLAPGTSDTVGMQINTSVDGYRYGFLTFTTSDPNQPIYGFALEGEVDPSIAIPAVSIYTRDSNAAETGEQPGVIRVQRTGDLSDDLTVNLIIGGTATNGADYLPIPTTVVIPAGQSAASVIITPIDDTAVESTETAVVSLASSSDYSAGPNSSATISIADNDTLNANTKITGTVYLDTNFNTYQDSGETGVSGITLYLDTNSNGQLDSGEPTTTTDTNGNYTFSTLAAGLYSVRIDGNGAYVLSTPVGSYSAAEAQTTTVNLGVFPISFAGTSGNDTFTIAPAATESRMLITAGGVTYNALRSQLPSLTFTGLGGNDSLSLDAALLANPPGLISAMPITFTGGSGTNSITLTDTTASEDLNIQAAQLTLADSIVDFTGTTSIVLDAAANSTIALHNLTIASAAVSMPAGKTLVLSVASLSITGGGTLDIADNDMVITNGSLGTWNGTAYTGILGLLQTGRSGNWTGAGINSSSAGASGKFSIGEAGADALLGLTGNETGVWEGQTVGASSVLVKYTYSGDANLDGRINGDDYFAIDAHVNQNGSVFGWNNGDFNYDGRINGDDYFIIDSNINQQGPPLAVTNPPPLLPVTNARQASSPFSTGTTFDAQFLSTDVTDKERDEN